MHKSSYVKDYSMNKKVSLSVLCTVLVSTLCNGTDTEDNLSSHTMGILPGGCCIYEKQQEMHERPEMQKMREKLKLYRIELYEHKEVSKKVYKKVRFWLVYPMSLVPTGLVSGFFLGVASDYDAAIIRTLIGGTIASGLTFAVSSFITSHILSEVKAGRIFNEWNRKNQLEGYLAGGRIAIKSLGTQLSKEELNLLLQEEKNKEVKRLLSDIVLTKEKLK